MSILLKFYRNINLKIDIFKKVVNDNIRMYKKSNLKMYKNVHR